jgi:hypothetical protein
VSRSFTVISVPPARYKTAAARRVVRQALEAAGFLKDANLDVFEFRNEPRNRIVQANLSSIIMTAADDGLVSGHDAKHGIRGHGFSLDIHGSLRFQMCDASASCDQGHRTRE